MLLAPATRTFGARLCNLGLPAALATALVVAPVSPVLAAPNVTPDQATSLRKPVQQRAQSLIAAGDHSTAAAELDAKATEIGDPLLFLDAADAYYGAAEADADIFAAQMGLERAKIALDILHFLQDPAADSGYKPVANWQVGNLIQRANDHIRKSNDLIAQIESGDTGPVEDGGEVKKKRGGAKNGLVIGGAVATGLGVVGLGVGVAGLAIGSSNQSAVEDPTVYGTEYDDYEDKGKRGNMLAIVGLAAGGVLVATGVALLVLGVKRGKKATEPSVAIAPAANGLLVSGRF